MQPRLIEMRRVDQQLIADAALPPGTVKQLLPLCEKLRGDRGYTRIKRIQTLW